MEGILYISIAVLIFGLVRIFTICLHELSHALLALLYTKRELIEVFIGSTGEKQKGLKLRLSKRLNIYIQFLPWKLYCGLCKYPKNTMEWHQEVKMLLAGNVTSFVLFIASAIFLKINTYEFLDLLGNFFLVCTLMDFLTNMISRKSSFTLYDSTTQRTDIDQINKILVYNDLSFSQASKELFKKQEKVVKKEQKTIRQPKQENTQPTVKGNRMSDN